MNGSFLLTRLASETGLLPNQVLSIAMTAPLRYKVFKVPKRTSGWRTLAQPAREVKNLQYHLGELLRSGLPIHEAVSAYEVGCSIRKNAAAHAGGAFLLKLDFENFFPSILADDFVRHLKRHHTLAFSVDDLDLISRILFWAPTRKLPLQLCIGAPTSPLVSNSVLYDFDCQVSLIAARSGVVYTRYADDLSFSTVEPNVLGGLIGEIEGIVARMEYPKLRINAKKTVHASRASRRVVTGIVIKPDGTLSVGRSRKRLIRAMWHRERLGLLSPDESRKLDGLVNFAESVEPGFRKWLEGNGGKGGRP